MKKRSKKKIRIEDFLYADPLAVDAFNNALRNKSTYDRLYNEGYDEGLYGLESMELKRKELAENFDRGLTQGFQEGMKGFAKELDKQTTFYYGEGLKEGFASKGDYLLVSRKDQPQYKIFNDKSYEARQDGPLKRMILELEYREGNKIKGVKKGQKVITKANPNSVELNDALNAIRRKDKPVFKTDNYKLFYKGKGELSTTDISFFPENVIPKPNREFKTHSPAFPAHLYKTPERTRKTYNSPKREMISISKKIDFDQYK